MASTSEALNLVNFLSQIFADVHGSSCAAVAQQSPACSACKPFQLMDGWGTEEKELESEIEDNQTDSSSNSSVATDAECSTHRIDFDQDISGSGSFATNGYVPATAHGTHVDQGMLGSRSIAADGCMHRTDNYQNISGSSCFVTDGGMHRIDDGCRGDGISASTSFEAETANSASSPPSDSDCISSGRIKRKIECESDIEAYWDSEAGRMSLDTRWDANFALLLKYGELNGHCNPPHKGSRLGQWVDNQRKYQKANRLRPDRLQRLQTLVKAGVFRWAAGAEELDLRRRDLWEYYYKHLLDFCAQHGHCNVPQKYVVPGTDCRLGIWLMNQRSQADTSIYPENIDKLRRLAACGLLKFK